MREQLLNAGFLETSTGLFVLKNDRFRVEAFNTTEGWQYKWQHIGENCGGGPNNLMNITQLNFYR